MEMHDHEEMHASSSRQPTPSTPFVTFSPHFKSETSATPPYEIYSPIKVEVDTIARVHGRATEDTIYPTSTSSLVPSEEVKPAQEQWSVYSGRRARTSSPPTTRYPASEVARGHLDRANSLPLSSKPDASRSGQVSSYGLLFKFPSRSLVLEERRNSSEANHIPASYLDSLQEPMETVEGPFASTSRLSPSPPVLQQDERATLADERAILADWEALPPTPPRRNLRTRKPAQLAPYTTEMQKYRRRLVRNDWQDAVVVEREFLRAQREKRREREDRETRQSSGEEDSIEKGQEIEKRRNEKDVGDRITGKRKAPRRRQSPLQDRSNVESRHQHGEAVNSSSEEEGRIGMAKDGSGRMDADHQSSPSSSSQGARRPVRKRQRNPLLSESESGSKSSSNEMYDVEECLQSEDDATDANGAITVSEDDEIRDREGGWLSRMDAVQSRYYRQQFKVLQRTMPKGAARRYIEDLIAMHREEEEDGVDDEETMTLNAREERKSSAEQQADEILRPGESRKRMLPNRERGDFLIDDADEESDDSILPTPISSSESSDEESAEIVETDDFTQQWLYTSKRTRRDEIDRLLTSAATRSKPRRYQDRSGGSKDNRQSKESHRKAPANREQMPRTTMRGKGKKRSKVTDYRRLPSKLASSKRVQPQNPPIVQRRSLPRFSLLRDEALFDGLSSSSSIVEEDTRHSIPRTPITPAKSLSSGTWSRDQPPMVMSRVSSLQKASSPLLPVIQEKERHYGAGHWTAPIDVDQDSPLPKKSMTKATNEILTQKRLEMPTRSETELLESPAHILRQKASMGIWQEVCDLRLDFGLRPPPSGISFQAETYLGRGRLFELIQLGKGTGEIAPPRPVNAFGVELNATTFDHQYLKSGLDLAREELIRVLKLEVGTEEEARFQRSLSELFRFVSVWLTAAEQDSVDVVKTVLESCFEYIDDFIAITRASRGGKKHFNSLLLQSLRWYKIEFVWRDSIRLAARTAEYEEDKLDNQGLFLSFCQELMLELLIYGMHYTMQSVKKASEPRETTVANEQENQWIEDESTMLNDQSAQYWVSLLHLFHQEASLNLFGPFATFWHVFEAVTKQYQAALSHSKDALLVAENGWYCLFAICTLSYFSATTGVTTFRSCLGNGHWPLVLQALSQLRLRVDEQAELSMSRTAIETRDGYIRLILIRVLHLHTKWGLGFDSSEATLGKLFALFDSHKLQDLPSEKNHDFPSFLRLYDESQLMEEVKDEDSSFHIFLKILARAAKDLGDVNRRSAKEAERNVARLFSRFSPLRTMNFQKELAPTALERSVLYNHYSIALIYLYLVPSSQQQRLLQIQQYLLFSKADDKSQLVCIRAMMYAITILQHHRLEIVDAVNWFKGVLKMLVGRMEDLYRIGAMSGRELKWEKDVKAQKTLLIAALRSMEYVIRMESLDKNQIRNEYPNLLFLDRSWTSALLESQLAVENTELADEVCHLFQTFLIRRQAVMTEEKRRGEQQNDTINRESQDSCAFLFDDDVDFDEALYAEAVDYPFNPTNRQSEGKTTKSDDIQSRMELFRRLDYQFAQLLHSAISPALFRLLSNLFHPERVAKYSLIRNAPLTNHRPGDGYLSLLNCMIDQTTKTTRAERIIDTWSWCAWIMVEENEIRQWNVYFNYGSEDPKRLQGEIAKRDVTLRFLVMISSKCLQQGSLLSSSSSSSSTLRGASKMYEANLVEFWNSFFASFTRRDLSSQHLLCNNLRELEKRREGGDGGGGLMRNVDWQGKSRWSLEDFELQRLPLIFSILENFSDECMKSKQTPKALFFSSLTSLLFSIRSFLTQDRKGNQYEEYLGFCRAITSACREKLSETVLRGIGMELNKTEAVIETKWKEFQDCKGIVSL